MILAYLKRRNNYFKNLRMLTESLRRPEELGLGKNEQQLKETITQDKVMLQKEPGQNVTAVIALQSSVYHQILEAATVTTATENQILRLLVPQLLKKNSKLCVSLAPDSKFQTRGSAFDRVSSIQGKVVENSISAPSSSHIIQLSFTVVIYHLAQESEGRTM